MNYLKYIESTQKWENRKKSQSFKKALETILSDMKYCKYKF